MREHVPQVKRVVEEHDRGGRLGRGGKRKALDEPAPPPDRRLRHAQCEGRSSPPATAPANATIARFRTARAPEGSRRGRSGQRPSASASATNAATTKSPDCVLDSGISAALDRRRHVIGHERGARARAEPIPETPQPRYREDSTLAGPTPRRAARLRDLPLERAGVLAVRLVERVHVPAVRGHTNPRAYRCSGSGSGASSRSMKPTCCFGPPRPTRRRDGRRGGDVGRLKRKGLRDHESPCDARAFPWPRSRDRKGCRACGLRPARSVACRMD